MNRDHDGRQYVGIGLHRRRSVLRRLGAQLNGQEDIIDEATHAVSDARVTHREEIGFSLAFGASAFDALAPVVAKLAGT